MLSATALVPRLPIQLNLVLVRIAVRNLHQGYEMYFSNLFFMFLHVHVAELEPPRITTHPQEIKDAVQGKAATFTIQVTGAEPLKYHWQWNSAEGGKCGVVEDKRVRVGGGELVGGSR